MRVLLAGSVAARRKPVLMIALVVTLFLLGASEAAKTRVTAMAKATSKATAHSLATAKDVDDTVDVDGGGDQGAESGAPSGGFDQSQVMDAFQADLAMRAANDRHNMMQSFMHNFAKNMKMAVLSDSQGDMPEDERQRMMAELRGDEVPEQEPDAAPPPRRRRRHRQPPRERMLNGGRPVEEEEHMLNGGRRVEEEPAAMHSEDQPMSEDEQATPPRPRRRRMLNGGRRSDASSGATKAKMAQVKQAHAAFMRKLNECADVDCVKQLYARQNQFHQTMVRHRSSQGDEESSERRMPREQQRVKAEADDGAEADQSEEAPPPEEDFSFPPPRRSRAEEEDEGSSPADDEDAPRFPPKERHPTVRDELGRPMPLLFGSPSGAEQLAPETKKSAAEFSARHPSFLFLGCLSATILVWACGA